MVIYDVGHQIVSIGRSHRHTNRPMLDNVRPGGVRMSMRIVEAGTHGCPYHAFQDDLMDSTNRCKHPRRFDQKCDDIRPEDCPLPKATQAQQKIIDLLDKEYDEHRAERVRKLEIERSKRKIENCKRIGCPVLPENATEELCAICSYYKSKWVR